MGLIYYLCLDATRQGQASFAHVHEIIRGLKKRGWQVRLFEPSYASSTAPPSMLLRVMEFIKVQWSLWCAVPKPNVLYIREHSASFPSTIWARLLGIPFICEVNGPYEDTFSAWPWTRKFASAFRFLTRTQLRLAGSIITVTDGLSNWVACEIGRTGVAHVIPNGANTDLFEPKAEVPINMPKQYAVFFGSFAVWQGIETILESVQLPTWPNDVKLVFLGDGTLKHKIFKAANTSDKVIYVGIVPYNLVPGIVAGSIVGLCPKTNVGGNVLTGLNPLKIFETLACSVPVVVTDFPGQSEIVRLHGCGFVIPPEDPHALAAAVEYLYSHSEERQQMGIRGRQFAEKEASWDIRAEQTSVILQSMIRSDPL